MANGKSTYTLTIATDTVEIAQNIKASHDDFFKHESVIDGNVVTCGLHYTTGLSENRQIRN